MIRQEEQMNLPLTDLMLDKGRPLGSFAIFVLIGLLL